MAEFLKNRILALTGIGLLLLGTSLFWEYVRLRPTYRFVIRPWSLRGYETTQGIVIAVGALLLLVLVVLVANGVIKESLVHSVALAGFVTATATVIAILSDARDVTLAGVAILMLALLATWALDIALVRFAWGRLSRRQRRMTRVAVWAVGSLILLLAVFVPIFGGEERPGWLVTLVAFGLVSVVSVLRPPTGLAPHRMIINGVVAVWAVTITTPAALRVTLLQEQFETTGVAAELADAQITSGLIIAWVAGLIAFSGAVGLWAKRRELIDARDRARRQLEAAAESEAELRSA